jgi:hypothetical protein
MFVNIYDWRRCQSDEIIGIWTIIINVVARFYDVVTLPTKQFSTHLDIVRCRPTK